MEKPVPLSARVPPFFTSNTAICMVLALAVALAFSPILRNGFTAYDDPSYVVQNPHVNTGLSLDNVGWAITAAHSSNWHPLTWISHQLDCTLYGLAPAGHHLTSLLLHVANTVLLFLWLSGLTGFKGRSAFIALAFGLHPLHVESVAWVSERKDLLCGLFWMLTLLAYTSYARKPSLRRYLLVAAVFACALLSKPMAVTLPVVLLLLDWWPLDRLNRKSAVGLVQEKLPLLALSCLSSALTVWAQRQSAFVPTLNELPLPLRLANAAISLIRYIAKTARPVRLAIFYPFPFNGNPAWVVGLCLVALLGVSWLAFATRRERPWLAAGWCWYLVTLVPVIGLVQAGQQAMADRYMYLPMVGLLIMVAWEGARLSERLRTPALVPLAAVAVLMVWTVLSWRQEQVWKNQMTLFMHALDVTQNNFVAHNNLGTELEVQGRPDEAIWHFQEAMRLKPGDETSVNNYAVASFLKGEQLYNSGKLDEALPHLKEGLRYHPKNAAAHHYLAMILTQQNQLAPAIEEFRLALKNDPSLAGANLGLGIALAQSGQPAAAEQAFEAALLNGPSKVEAFYRLGLARAAQGHWNEAVQSYDSALSLDSGYDLAKSARAQALAHLTR